MSICVPASIGEQTLLIPYYYYNNNNNNNNNNNSGYLDIGDIVRFAFSISAVFLLYTFAITSSDLDGICLKFVYFFYCDCR